MKAWINGVHIFTTKETMERIKDYLVKMGEFDTRNISIRENTINADKTFFSLDGLNLRMTLKDLQDLNKTHMLQDRGIQIKVVDVEIENETISERQKNNDRSDKEKIKSLEKGKKINL